MSKAMEELIQEEIREEKIKTVMRINEFGKSTVDEMTYYVDLPVSEVKEIVELSDVISM